MPTTIVSLGTNQLIDVETPETTGGGAGANYAVTFITTPTGISIGDIGVMLVQPAGGTALPNSVYTFLVTGIGEASGGASDDVIFLKYCQRRFCTIFIIIQERAK